VEACLRGLGFSLLASAEVTFTPAVARAFCAPLICPDSAGAGSDPSPSALGDGNDEAEDEPRSHDAIHDALDRVVKVGNRIVELVMLVTYWAGKGGDR
jgi:hypothetical protein